MPDLMTHLAASYLVKRGLSPNQYMVAFLMGAALPDLATYAPMAATSTLPGFLVQLGCVVPLWVRHLPDFFHPFHGVVPAFVLGWLLAFVFPAAGRPWVFLNIVMGEFLHLAMDLLQVNHNSFGTFLLPFSWRSLSLGWIGSEDSLYALPFLAAAVLITLLCDHRKKRGQGGTRSSMPRAVEKACSVRQRAVS